MTGSFSFHARACFTIEADRIYRIELHNDCLYFLRVGGQFDLERGLKQGGGPSKLLALVVLAAGETFLRKRKREELIARDANMDPEKLVGIHPHNYKLSSADIRRATILPKRWFLALFRRHYGRLIVEQMDGKRQEFHFESDPDLRTAAVLLRTLLGHKLDSQIR